MKQLVTLLLLLGCGEDSTSPLPSGWSELEALPQSITNNASAAATRDGECILYTATGLQGGLSSEFVTNGAYKWADEQWAEIAALPESETVVAAAGGILNGKFVVSGGFSIAPSGQEVSSTAIHSYDDQTNSWTQIATHPTAIDDHGFVVWKDRYLVTVSGWSNTQNSDLVQIWDSETDTWHESTFPGTKVFGHASALLGNQLLIIDGVDDGLQFDIVKQAWLGTLTDDPTPQITWKQTGPAPGPARYRAAGGVGPDGKMWFVGGTDTPYNYNGLRYDNGQAALPIPSTLVFDPTSEIFSLEDGPLTASMDHRNLAHCGDNSFLVGGMLQGPTATSKAQVVAP